MTTGRLHVVLHHLRRLADAPEAGGVNDAQLLERFVAHRDPAAFELLLWRHERLVHNVCRRVLRDAHDADDAFQATFLVLVRKAASIGRGESVAGWLYRVAHRVALRAQAAAVQRDRHERRGVDLAEVSSRRADCADADWRDLRPVLDAELSRLPERYRVPIVLCYLEGKSYEEAARQLGCSRGTVSTWLTRARELLQRRLTRRGLTLSTGLLAGLLAAHAAPVSAAVSLIEDTVKTALPAAAGKAAVSANVAALTEGVLRAMFLNKVKVAAAVVLAAGILVGSAGALTYPVLASNLVAAVPAAPEEAAAAGPGNAAEPPLPLPASGAQPKENTAWKERAVLNGYTAQVTSLAFSPDGRTLATASLDGSALLWEVASWKKIAEYRPGASGVVRAVAFSPDGKALAVGSCQPGKAGVVDLLDVPSCKVLARLQGHDDLVTSVAFAPDGKVLATAASDGTARLWDAGTGRQRVAIRAGGKMVLAVAFSPDGKFLATAGGEEVVKEDGKPGELRLWEAATGREVRRFTRHEGPITSVAFSPDGKVLASAGFDKAARLWDMETGKELAALTGHRGRVQAVAFSPGGRLLATGSLDCTVKLWDVAAYKEIATLEGHSHGVLCLAFAPDGKALASGSGQEHELGNGEPDVRIWAPQGTPAGSTAKAPPAAPETGDGDRLDQLIQDLLKSKRTDEQAVEAIYLATLGRFPTDAEKDGALKHLARKKDRPEALADLLWALTQAKEFGENVDVLTKRRLQRPVK